MSSPNFHCPQFAKIDELNLHIQRRIAEASEFRTAARTARQAHEAAVAKFLETLSDSDASYAIAAATRADEAERLAAWVGDDYEGRIHREILDTPSAWSLLVGASKARETALASGLIAARKEFAQITSERIQRGVSTQGDELYEKARDRVREIERLVQQNLGLRNSLEQRVTWISNGRTGSRPSNADMAFGNFLTLLRVPAGSQIVTEKPGQTAA